MRSQGAAGLLSFAVWAHHPCPVMTQGKTLSVGSGRRFAAPRTRFAIEFVAIACVAVAVRSFRIGDASLWNDELFSRFYPDLFSLHFLWTTGFLRENSPPLYYMAIEAWMQLFGTGEVAMRSLSLVASVLALPLVHLIGKELFGRRCGLISALVFALSPMQVSFAQEARPYALLLLPVGAALLAIARFLRGDMRGRVLLLYCAGTIVGIYCHATAAFFIGACNIVVIYAVLSDARTERYAALTRWIGANAIVGFAALPELVSMLMQGRDDASLRWIAPFEPLDVVRAFSSLVSGVSTPVKLPGAELTTALLLLLAACFVATRPGRRAAAVIVGIPAAFAALLAVASLIEPVFLARALCWMGIPLAVALGHALVTPTRLRPVLLAVAVLTSATGLGYEFMLAHKEPWRALLREIEADLVRADHVILAPFTGPTAFAYYAPAVTHLESWDIGPQGTVEFDELPQRLGVQRVPRDQIVRDIRSGARVWLILRTPDLPYVSNLLADVAPPRIDIRRSCGKVICLAAISW